MPPGLTRRKPPIHFHAELYDEADPAWAAEIDQAIFRGSLLMAEVAFFHRPSRTAIIGDLIQRFTEQQASGWKRFVVRLGGVAGEHGGTPCDWRATFLRRGPARAALQKVLAWTPEQLLIAHGQCGHAGATQIIEAALRWM
jgi:hypothetical protein